MDTNIGKLQTKRFVIEDSYTKVTADGEPHEMMTLIAGLSGVLAAIIILIILISLVACKKDKRTRSCENCASGRSSVKCMLNQEKKRLKEASNDAKHSPISTVSTRVPNLVNSPSQTPDITDFIITGGNFGSNLNTAFVDSELNLADTLGKAKKKMRWHDDLITTRTKETVIDMTER